MEKVLVIEKQKLNNLLKTGDYNFFTHQKEDFLKIANESDLFISRNIAEKDINFKQVIPYGFLTYQEKFYMLKRLPKQNEERLHNKFSIGVGGHINPVDSIENKNIVKDGLLREMNEEVDLQNNKIISMEYIGVIYDDITEVGKVHLGFVYHIILENENIEILEKDKMEGHWIHKNKLNDYIVNMETWSKIILEALN